jgi:hypothetical protein
VLVVHHARKAAGNARAGQALRGSSEFHAWGDSNLYLRRDGDDLTLTVEHRAAPSLAPIAIALTQRGPALALQAVDPPEASTSAQPAAPGPSPLDERITAALADSDGAMPFAALRSTCRVRAATLYERLAALTAAGRVAKTDNGYRLADR